MITLDTALILHQRRVLWTLYSGLMLLSLLAVSAADLSVIGQSLVSLVVVVGLGLAWVRQRQQASIVGLQCDEAGLIVHLLAGRHEQGRNNEGRRVRVTLLSAWQGHDWLLMRFGSSGGECFVVSLLALPAALFHGAPAVRSLQRRLRLLIAAEQLRTGELSAAIGGR